MPDKLTNAEIKKALECCKNDGIICFQCPYKKTNGCMEKLSADALDLINRLQAENERFKNSWKADVILTTRTEAYKEFAERLNRIEKFRSLVESDNYELSVTMREVDNLLKEMGVEGDG